MSKGMRNLHRLTGGAAKTLRDMHLRHCRLHPSRPATHAVWTWNGAKPACAECAAKAKQLGYDVDALDAHNR